MGWWEKSKNKWLCLVISIKSGSGKTIHPRLCAFVEGDISLLHQYCVALPVWYPRSYSIVLVMFQHALRRFTTETRSIQRFVRYAPSFHSVPSAFVSTRNFTDVKDVREQPFDTSLLDFLVCPLSKKPLRSVSVLTIQRNIVTLQMWCI